MNILHLISGGDTGGAKTHVLSLIKELSKTEKVKIVCFIEDEFYHDGKAMGIDIEIYKQNSRFDISVINRLTELIEKEKFEIVHCHGARANFIAMFLRHKIKIPMITTVHSDYKLDFKDTFYKKVIFTTLNSYALKKFNYYIAVSRNFKEMLVERNFNPDKIYTVYNGIDLEEKSEIIEKEAFLKKYNLILENQKVVGIVSRLDSNKNVELLIRAAISMLTRHDDIRFLIAGEGVDAEKLKHMVKENDVEKEIQFLGHIRDTESFYDLIDINVLTSNSESFPYVILEGAKHKKMIISTDVGGISDLVENGINGYLIEVGNQKQLEEAINEALENNRYKQMGQKLYEKVERKFSLKNMAQDHVEIYKSILKS